MILHPPPPLDKALSELPKAHLSISPHTPLLTPLQKRDLSFEGTW